MHSGGLVLPLLDPLLAIHDRAEAGHAVQTADAPAGGGLLQTAADEVLARAFNLPAANRTALLQSLGVVQFFGTHPIGRSGQLVTPPQN